MVLITIGFREYNACITVGHCTPIVFLCLFPGLGSELSFHCYVLTNFPFSLLHGYTSSYMEHKQTEWTLYYSYNFEVTLKYAC